MKKQDSVQNELLAKLLDSVNDLAKVSQDYRNSFNSKAIYSTEWFLFEQKIKNCLNKVQKNRDNLRSFAFPGYTDVLPLNDDEPT